MTSIFEEFYSKWAKLQEDLAGLNLNPECYTPAPPEVVFFGIEKSGKTHLVQRLVGQMVGTEVTLARQCPMRVELKALAGAELLARQQHRLGAQPPGARFAAAQAAVSQATVASFWVDGKQCGSADEASTAIKVAEGANITAEKTRGKVDQITLKIESSTIAHDLVLVDIPGLGIREDIDEFLYNNHHLIARERALFVLVIDFPRASDNSHVVPLVRRHDITGERTTAVLNKVPTASMPPTLRDCGPPSWLRSGLSSLHWIPLEHASTSSLAPAATPAGPHSKQQQPAQPVNVGHVEVLNFTDRHTQGTALLRSALRDAVKHSVRHLLPQIELMLRDFERRAKLRVDEREERNRDGRQQLRVVKLIEAYIGKLRTNLERTSVDMSRVEEEAGGGGGDYAGDDGEDAGGGGGGGSGAAVDSSLARMNVARFVFRRAIERKLAILKTTDANSESVLCDVRTLVGHFFLKVRPTEANPRIPDLLLMDILRDSIEKLKATACDFLDAFHRSLRNHARHLAFRELFRFPELRDGVVQGMEEVLQEQHDSAKLQIETMLDGESGHLDLSGVADDPRPRRWNTAIPKVDPLNYNFVIRVEDLQRFISVDLSSNVVVNKLDKELSQGEFRHLMIWLRRRVDQYIELLQATTSDVLSKICYTALVFEPLHKRPLLAQLCRKVNMVLIAPKLQESAEEKRELELCKLFQDSLVQPLKAVQEMRLYLDEDAHLSSIQNLTTK